MSDSLAASALIATLPLLALFVLLGGLRLKAHWAGLASLAVAVAGIVLLAEACGSRPSGKPVRRAKQRVFVMGFDGMDPDLVQQWMAEGQLPTLARLAKEGGLYPLTTTHSPESPTAWASFATGVNAGKHNIYDFLVRDTATYLPDLGMVKRDPARFLFNYIPISKPKLSSIRGGTSFWVTAGEAGVRSSVLTVPVTFPPENVHVLKGRQATLANIRREFEEWLPSVAQPSDRVVVFFAGHGFVKNGRGYLAGWDVHPDRPRGRGQGTAPRPTARVAVDLPGRLPRTGGHVP